MLVEDIRAKFPIKNIPAIVGEPTYKAIKTLWGAKYANSAAILTTLRGGHNGHIGLIMDASVYANFTTTAYARPMEPDPYAQH